MVIERVVSALVIATGLISTGVGVAVATSRLREARRAYRRTEFVYRAMPEGWTSWFVEGFSTMAMGTHWFWASVALVTWTLAGLGLIGLGLRLLSRA